MSRKDKRPAVQPPAPPESPALWWLWGIGLIWAIWICFHFYKQQPFSYLTILNTLLSGQPSILPKFLTLLSYLKGFAFAAMMATSAFFIGQLLLSRFKAWGSALEWFVFSTALGYGVLAYVMLGLAAGGLLYKEAIRVGVAVLFLGALFYLWKSGDKEKLGGITSDLKKSFFPGGIGSFLGCLLAFVLLTDFVMAFVPELFYDALVYHLGAPNFYLQEHRLAPIHLMTAKFPLTIQMLHLLGLALQDEMVTKLTHFALMLLIIGGMLSFGLRLGRRLLGVLSAVLFCSIPTVQLNVWTSGVDMGVTLFGFLAFLAFFFSLEKEEQQFTWFLLAGVFSGLVFASKYTAAYVPAALGLTLFTLVILKRVSFSRALLWGSAFSGVLILVMVPWFLKNFIETGNPVYPFLSQYFGGETLAVWRYQILYNENQGFTPKNILEIPKMLWSISVSERSSLSFQGPMFLACVPFALAAFFKEKPRSYLIMGVYVVFVCVLGFLLTRLTRYLLPAFAVLACLLAYGVETYLADRSLWRRWGAVFVVVLCFLQQMSWAYLFLGGSFQPQNVLLGRESRFNYVNRYHNGMNPNPPNQMYQVMEKRFTPAQKVLLLGEEKAFGLNVRHTYSGVYDRGILVRVAEEAANPQEMATRILEQGITHIMMNVFEANRIAGYGGFSMSPQAFGRLAAFWETHLKFVHLEFNPPSGENRNPILLLEIAREPLGPQDRPIENLIAPIYERNELARLGIDNSNELRAFYEERVKEQPKTTFLRSRLQELSQNITK